MAKQPYLGEGLLAPGVIRLFGRKFEGLILGKEGIDPTSNNPLVLQEQIEGLTKRLDDIKKPAEEPPPPADADLDPDDDPVDKPQDGTARLARIYGFSYLGNYYKIANPPVIRVYGQGFPVRSGFAPDNHMNILGVEFKDEDFVRGIRMWPSDHLDVAVRIDITIGWLREILLDPDMSKDTNVTGNSCGGRADVVGRDSGLVGRDSGLVGRDSGLVGRDSGFVGRSRR
jgi:hypothetical protein